MVAESLFIVECGREDSLCLVSELISRLIASVDIDRIRFGTFLSIVSPMLFVAPRLSPNLVQDALRI